LTVADYQQQAQALIAQFHQPYSLSAHLGWGTGLYIRSVVQGLKFPELHKIAIAAASLGQPQLYAMLQQLTQMRLKDSSQ